MRVILCMNIVLFVSGTLNYSSRISPGSRVELSDSLVPEKQSEKYEVPGGLTTLLGIKPSASGYFEWTFDLDAGGVPSTFTIANISEFRGLLLKIFLFF